jgi:hypothetical protein
MVGEFFYKKPNKYRYPVSRTDNLLVSHDVSCQLSTVVEVIGG